MSTFSSNEKERLFLELQSMEDRGITIWLEGSRSSPRDVAEAMSVNEESAYMRDYVFAEGRLTQLRFDRVKEQ